MSEIGEGQHSIETKTNIAIAQKALKELLFLNNQEKFTILKDQGTNSKTTEIIAKAANNIGSQVEIIEVPKKITKKEVIKITKESKVVADLTTLEGTTAQFYEDELLEKNKYSLACLTELEPEVFDQGGILDINPKEIEYILGRFEAILKNAKGLQVKTSYGTNLEVGLRAFNERRWFKDDGKIQRGRCDNLLPAEIFTTPNEIKVNGILVLSALDSEIDSSQGVDEFVKLEIKDGIIVSIKGEKSAIILKKQLAKDIRKEKNPWNTLRVAEIAFGANPQAKGRVKSPFSSFDFEGFPTVEAEKTLGTIHIAFGDSKHGEKGTEGFEEARSHYDFVIPKPGLTVIVFNSETDFEEKKNGINLISNGEVNI